MRFKASHCLNRFFSLFLLCLVMILLKLFVFSLYTHTHTHIRSTYWQIIVFFQVVRVDCQVNNNNLFFFSFATVSARLLAIILCLCVSLVILLLVFINTYSFIHSPSSWHLLTPPSCPRFLLLAYSSVLRWISLAIENASFLYLSRFFSFEPSLYCASLSVVLFLNWSLLVFAIRFKSYRTTKTRRHTLFLSFSLSLSLSLFVSIHSIVYGGIISSLFKSTRRAVVSRFSARVCLLPILFWTDCPSFHSTFVHLVRMSSLSPLRYRTCPLFVVFPSSASCHFVCISVARLVHANDRRVHLFIWLASQDYWKIFFSFCHADNLANLRLSFSLLLPPSLLEANLHSLSSDDLLIELILVSRVDLLFSTFQAFFMITW